MKPRELIPDQYYAVPLLYLGCGMFSITLGGSQIITLTEDEIRRIPHRCTNLGAPLPPLTVKPQGCYL